MVIHSYFFTLTEQLEEKSQNIKESITYAFTSKEVNRNLKLVYNISQCLKYFSKDLSKNNGMTGLKLIHTFSRITSRKKRIEKWN